MTLLTQQEAYNQGYCHHCASYAYGRWYCVFLKSEVQKGLCSLTEEHRERWRQEFGQDRTGKVLKR